MQLRQPLGRVWKCMVVVCLLFSGTLPISTAHAAPLRQVGCATAMTVNDATGFNNAILCFNTQTTAGSYTITLAADITFPDIDLLSISNATPGISLTIRGGNHTLTSGRRLNIEAQTVVTIEHLVITGDGVENAGTLTVNHSTIRNTRVGIANAGNGTVVLNHSTIRNIVSEWIAVGIANFEGTVTVNNSTLSQNQGTALFGVIWNRGTMTLNHSTVSENQGDLLGGIANEGTLNLSSSLIANNGNIDCANGNGGIVNASHSLIGSGLACVNGTNINNVSGDPLLGPLQDNGGPTFTQALLSGSPALDVADPASCLPTDQRDVFRPQGAGCDIGAYELVVGTLIGTCGGYEVRQVNQVYQAPGWNGMVKVGTSKNDTLNGTNERDLILGLGGNDKIDGKGGDDVLCGGDGVDLLQGFAGKDYLDGGNGNDVLNGGTGDHDSLVGGDGNDALLDGDGVIKALGGPGNDLFTLALRNGWRDNNGQMQFAGRLAAGYGNDTVVLVILDRSPFFVDVTGDERDDPPSTLEGRSDGLGLLGNLNPTPVRLKFERQLVVSAEADALVSEETGAEYLTEPVGEEAPAQTQSLFLPLVTN